MADVDFRVKHFFQNLPKERLREIASKGGKAAQATGRCHSFTTEEAREAGRKGAAVRAEKRREHELAKKHPYPTKG